MIRRNTWILIILFAALVGFAFYLQNQKARQAASATPTSSTVFVFNTATDGNPTDIKIESSTGVTVEVARESSGPWAVKSPVAMGADQAAAEAAATQIGSLRVLGDFQLGPDIVGLDKPSYTITIVFSSGKTHKLLVGSVNPIQTGYYTQLDGGKTQIVDKPGLDALLGIVTNPPYAQTLTPTVTLTPFPTSTATATPTIPPTETPAVSSTPGTPSPVTPVPSSAASPAPVTATAAP
jgi:hypothetical protein